MNRHTYIADSTEQKELVKYRCKHCPFEGVGETAMARHCSDAHDAFFIPWQAQVIKPAPETSGEVHIHIHIHK